MRPPQLFYLVSVRSYKQKHMTLRDLKWTWKKSPIHTAPGPPPLAWYMMILTFRMINDETVTVPTQKCCWQEAARVKGKRHTKTTIGSSFVGTCFRRYPLNERIAQNETRAQGVSACDLIFRNMLVWQKSKTEGSCQWLVMLSMGPAPFRQSSPSARVTDASRDLSCDPWSIHQPRPLPIPNLIAGLCRKDSYTGCPKS